MRAERRFRIADRYRCLEEGRERLADIDFLILLAHEDGDRRQASIGFLRSCLGLGQRRADFHDLALGFERLVPVGAREGGVLERGLNPLAGLREVRLRSCLRRFRALDIMRVSFRCQRFRTGGDLGLGLRAGRVSGS